MSGSWTTFQAPSSVGSFAAETMLLLSDGSVLIHESEGANWLRLTPDGEGNYKTGSWSGLLPMLNTRQFFSSAVLVDGRVYAIGGEVSNAGGDTPLAEIFDPQTNKWSALSKPASFSFIQGDASGCVLADGRVLFGNLQTTSPPFASCLWDPVTNVWTAAGSGFGASSSDSKRSNCNEETWTLLPDGSVLAVATLNEPKAERYVPAIDEWVPAGETPSSLVLSTITDPSKTVVNIFEIGPAILLPNGSVFAIGATGQTALYTPPAAGANPKTKPGTWVAGPAFPTDKSSGHVWPTLTASDAPAVLQTNGKVVCVAGVLHERFGSGGPDYFSKESELLEFDPSSATLKAFSPAVPWAGGAPETWECRMLLLPSAQILLTTQSQEIYLFTPDSATNKPSASWKPTITTNPATLVPGHTYTIEGTQLNGLSQAVSYGDDAQTATNFPIVRLSNAAGEVEYLRTFNFSTLAVATEKQTVSVEVEVPGSMTAGAWTLTVIANGIASNGVDVEVAIQDCYLTLERDTFGEGEIKAMIKLNGAPAEVDPAVYVVVEGYKASDIGLTASNLSNPPHKPSIAEPISGISAVFRGPVLPEDPSVPPGTVQRFTFPYALQFTGTSVFAGAPEALTVTADFNPPSQPAVSGHGVIHLIATPDPFILHGDVHDGYPWYLSTDLRVFQIKAGGTRFGATLATSGAAGAAATAFIQDVLAALNGDLAAAGPLFDAISQDEEVAETELAFLPEDSHGNRIFNFALARVRLQDVAAAKHVGVFFRMWQAQQTNATFNSGTIYKSAANSSGQLIPLLGIEGDEIATIPFFADARVDTSSVSMDTQTDAPNRRTIKPDSLGAETDAYFGCWLDINQPGELRFPDRMVGGNPANIPGGPFTGMGPLLSIQQLVRSTHQCLIAEISFAPDPVTPGSDPSDSDKLAQRNLTLVPAPNPGTPSSRRVPQTIEIRPTPVPLAPGSRPDELMIEWGEIPAGATADLYLPATSAAEILDLAAGMYATHRIKPLDAHTIEVPAGGVSYIPIPPGGGVNYVGLLSVNLPLGIHSGEQFDIVVKQLTSASLREKTRENNLAESAGSAVGDRFSWRRVHGVFKLQIPIGTKASLLGAEERNLSVLRWIGKSIPVESRWFPVFERYLAQLAERVSEMGGNPVQVLPSPTGHWREHGAGKGEEHGARHGHGEDCDALEFTGKITALIHDRFGDFEGFLLEERRSGAIARFRSRELGIAEVAERAWQWQTTVSVFADRGRREVPATVVLREAGRGDQASRSRW